MPLWPLTALLCLGQGEAPAELQVTAESELSSGGDLSSTVELRAVGETAAALRTFVAAQAADELFAATQQALVDQLPTAQLVGLRFGNLNETEEPFRLIIDYRLSGFALVGEGLFALPLPAGRPLLPVGPLARWRSAGHAPPPPAASELPALRVERHERLRLPEGFRLASPWSTAATTSAGVLSASVQQLDQAVELQASVTAPPLRLDSFTHPGVAALIAAIEQAAAHHVVLEPDGAPR